MRKWSGLKKAVMAVMASGMLCACGNNAQSGTGEPTGVQTEPAEPTRSPEATAPETTEPTELERESVIGDIVTEDVESVSIRFYVGYNIASGDLISDTIPCQTVEVSGEDLAKLSELLPELTKVTADPQSEEYGHIMYDHLMDYYELTINDDMVLDIGDEYGFVKDAGELFAVPTELFDTVSTVTEDYTRANVYKTLEAEQITVTNMDGEVVEVTDPEAMEIIQSLEYYTINADDETFAKEKVAYVVDLHNGEQLEVHYAGVCGKLIHADGSYEYVHIDGMEEFLDCLFAK
ncbi:MAG: hypothetical protein K6A72_03040 [Lachnospiraceae bacterium]|nr:hypothetical protein [Lachnospiraceae bacterium]